MIVQPHWHVHNVENEDDDDDDEVTIVEVNVRDETVAEQLQFWRSAASRMERSKLGTSSVLIEIMNMIKMLETMQHMQ